MFVYQCMYLVFFFLFAVTINQTNNIKGKAYLGLPLRSGGIHHEKECIVVRSVRKLIIICLQWRSRSNTQVVSSLGLQPMAYLHPHLEWVLPLPTLKFLETPSLAHPVCFYYLSLVRNSLYIVYWSMLFVYIC